MSETINDGGIPLGHVDLETLKFQDAQITATLKGPLSNLERAFLVADRKDIRRELAARSAKATPHRRTPMASETPTTPAIDLNDPVAVLIAAREKIAKPENWTTGDYAKDVEGNRVLPWEDSAVCFCSLGAIGSIVGSERQIYACTAYDLLDAATDIAAGHVTEIAEYNDSHSHAEVLLIWDAAIAKGQADRGVA